ncbi:hypothetical protein BN874_1300006 [Candidatus Contendobacter odensis Run_B_J11]|uniref:Uncharacterized protein n=1 Tax=Candidatus Contendobacter odensis Run_B_J11 TaxID=1400861 RepID=A0A7U7G8A1_9GAMM|nr:hypothetical protein BN874_1300006 [Candidatus Contendobacter odensis Run_B_J11]
MGYEWTGWVYVATDIGLPESVRSMARLSLTLSTIFTKHVAEQSALLNSVVKSDVSMRQRIEPVLGHVALGALAIVGF